MTTDLFFESIALECNEQMNFGDRVNLIIKKKGLSKSYMAEKLGVSRQAFNYILNHSNKLKYLDEIADLLQVNPSWLENGELPITLEQSELNTIQIPILNETLLIKSLINNTPFSDYEMITVDNATSDCFAFKILNDSMFPPFMENTLMIFDKSKKPFNGCYVIAHIKDDDSIVIRKYNKDGNDTYLTPSSDSYKSFTNPDAKIIGVLVESRFLFN